jgi:flavin-dependent dehydrogenase
MPRLRVPAARPGLLALGEAALGLDPLCGDGAGHALRGAWAAAEALTAGHAASLQVYQKGLSFAFDRHCRACAEHYAACGPEWAIDAERRCYL